MRTTADLDYRAGGLWLQVPASATSADLGHTFGAFVDIDGGDLFTRDNLAGLTGEATYRQEGGAVGVHSVVSDQRNFYLFDADVALTADFGDRTAPLGTINGTLSNLESQGQDYTGVTINLGTTNIEHAPGNGDGGAFRGDTSVTGADTTFTGEWGGQFYGNGAAATDHPGSVAGTFGAATADGGESFIGVFGADRE